MKISQIKAREILDSRGNPTVQVKVILDNSVEGVASVPSGASTGVHEALELRDGDKKRYGGKGVLKAVKNVNGLIAKLLNCCDVVKQLEIDEKMIQLDGTKNKSKLGANAILGVSLACARAAALATNLPLYKYLRQSYKLQVTSYKLPTPMMNILNGGRHADSSLEIQEFMIAPRIHLNTRTLEHLNTETLEHLNTINFKECVRVGAEIYYVLKNLLKKDGYSVGVGDEGGFAPKLKNNEEALRYLVVAIRKAGYRPGIDVSLALDCAASEFFDKGKYLFEGKKRTAKEMSQIYLGWVKKYPLISLEDPFAEDDWTAWRDFTETLKHLNTITLVVGDDLFVTNAERLKKGIKEDIANAILIKLNQIGTLSETMEAIKLAQKNDYKVIISHRSGETVDTFIADLAVAVGADFIKTGSLSRSERVEKYNRLMEIEWELFNC